jgi:hypothetical protein
LSVLASFLSALKPPWSLRNALLHIFFDRASEKEGTTFNMIVGNKLFVLPFWFKQ